MATLTSQDLKILESTRQRLAQLTSQIANLQHQLLTGEGDPLPSWTSLHTQSLILSQSLTTLSSHLESNSQFFDSAAVYPLPSFPGREQEPMLQTLLGKKLAPPAADWVEDGQKAGEMVMGRGFTDDSRQWKELWEWAAVEANDSARSHDWGAEEESEEDEDSDEEREGKGAGEDKMEVDGGIAGDGVKIDAKARPLEAKQWVQFMSKGYYEQKKRRTKQEPPVAHV